MRSISCRTSERIMVSMGISPDDEVEGEIEGVEIPPVTRRGIGGQLAVAEQRHLCSETPPGCAAAR